MATQLVRICLVEEDQNQLVVQPSKSKAAGCPNDCKFSRHKEKYKLDREKKFENLDNNNVSGCTLSRTKVRLETKRFQICGRISGALMLLSLHSPLCCSWCH